MTARDGNPLAVLVVEADDADRRTVAGALEEAGHAATAVETMADALDRLEDGDVDAVVAGHALPDGDGIALAEAVRERHGRLPVVLLADALDPGAADAALEASVDGVVGRTDGGVEREAVVERVEAVAAGAPDADREYRTILEAATDLVLVLDEEGRAQYVSPAVEPMLGLEPSALRDEVLFDRVHPEDREAVEAAFERVAEEGSFEHYLRFRARDADGAWHWLEPTATASAPDAADGLVVTIRDVTEQVRDEQRLARYETLFDVVPDGVYTTGPDGAFTMLNEALADLAGTDVESLLGRSAADFVADADLHETMALREALLAGERDAVEVEFDLETLDGRTRRVENRFVRLPAEGGTAGVVRDVSDRAAREAAVERQNERLQEFSAVISHDLRNPLTVAMGRLELAAETGEDEHLEDAREALARMERFLERLLDLARAGQDITEVEPVDLDDVVESAWRVAGAGAGRLEASSLGTLVCDPARTRQLLENLFANAAAHAGADATVRVERLPDGGFVVEDDGPGIPEADRDRVLEPGFSTGGDGTGLGLSIVRTIAHAHGWSVEVGESASGGARFAFRTGGGPPAAGDAEDAS